MNVNCPGLLNTIKKNYWHNTTGTHQKFVIVRTLIQRYDVPQWTNWSHRPNRVSSLVHGCLIASWSQVVGS